MRGALSARSPDEDLWIVGVRDGVPGGHHPRVPACASTGEHVQGVVSSIAATAIVVQVNASLSKTVFLTETTKFETVDAPATRAELRSETRWSSTRPQGTGPRGIACPLCPCQSVRIRAEEVTAVRRSGGETQVHCSPTWPGLWRRTPAGVRLSAHHVVTDANGEAISWTRLGQAQEWQHYQAGTFADFETAHPH